VFSTRESILIERNLTSGVEREIARGDNSGIGLSLVAGKTYARRPLAGGRGGVIVERDIESGAERDVFRHPHLTAFHSFDFVAREFGKSGRFAVTLTDPDTKITTWLSVPVSGGEPRELLRGTPGDRISFFTVSRDAKQLYLRKDAGPVNNPTNSELWRVALDSGTATHVELEGTKLGLEVLEASAVFAINPDGRRVAFVANRARRNLPNEVWVLENFLPKANP
jgi:hypothetical protein